MEPRFVLFIDSGHSSFSVSLCEISNERISLLKGYSLKFTGSRNVDILVL